MPKTHWDRHGTTLSRHPNAPTEATALMPGMLDAIARRAVEDMTHGRRSTKKPYRPAKAALCPACGMYRSNTGLCDCNGY